MANPTKVVTGKVRFSFLHVFDLYAQTEGAEKKYSATLLIPKKDKATIAKLQAAAKAARDAFREKNGKALPPESDAAIPGLGTVHDGDGQRPGGDDFGPECKGCYVVTVSSKNPPKLVDADKNEILDRADLKSGDYGKAMINAFGYKQSGNAGVSFGLNALMKTEDGEPLGAHVDVDDFDDENDEYKI